MEKILNWDIQVLNKIREVCTTPWLDSIMIGITTLGDVGFIWILLGFLFIAIGCIRNNKFFKKGGFSIMLALTINLIICNIILKPMVGRMRPYDLLEYEILINGLSDFSFPSGHTSASFAAATVLYRMNKKWGVVGFIFASLMGFTRVYLGVLFPTDVLGGVVIGIFSGWVGIALYGKIMKNRI